MPHYRPAAMRLEPRHPLRRRRMGAEQLAHPAVPASGLTWASGAAAGATCMGMRWASASSRRSAFASGIGAQDLGADPAGLELPLPRHRQLDQRRADRREQHQGELRHRMSARRLPAPEQEQVGQVAERARRSRPPSW